MKTEDIREKFLAFFADRGHQRVPSSSLVPAGDSSLLFTNAGMVQFKESFLGLDDRYQRAVSSQRCVRAGGKHNDLENVGYTARHHTFFEMLGNFSFGDYFKQEAIEYGWGFLTEVLKLDPARLWVTVYDDDDEAADIWLKGIGVDPQRFSRCGDADNFWTMGDTGPCGPCTEIFFDHGPAIAGGPPGTPEADGDRYIEIWNLVFTQYDRAADATLKPIPRRCVDTGMGLERLAAVLQGVHSNYDIDLFRALLDAVREISPLDTPARTSLQVVADHIRACSFLVVDGVRPSNEGRGYVLRRIIRRAIRHGRKLGIEEPFFYTLVAALDAQMGAAYPELRAARDSVAETLRQEEARFAETLDNGLKRFEQIIGDAANGVIPGEAAFQLYDTYGFPVDLTADMARERGLTVDMAAFEVAMEAQRTRARAASQFAAMTGGGPIPDEDHDALLAKAGFSGYECLENAATILAIYVDGKRVETADVGSDVMVVLDETPFYAESGGQVGDAGRLVGADGSVAVSDTRKDRGLHVHFGRVSLGRLNSGESVTAQVNSEHREPTMRNHSATHLLHAALREVLGTHVEQKGSLVAADRLRFDFAHASPMTAAELKQVENRVNAEVRANHAVETRLMPLEQALESGAMALFGEKYDEDVRVLSMGAFSVELCGGTHVARTGDIGLFKIVGESGIAAGVRRVEAVTGGAAIEQLHATEVTLDEAARLIKSQPDQLLGKLEQLATRLKELERENQSLKSKAASSQGSQLADEAVDINGVKVVASRLEGLDAGGLRETVDQLKSAMGSVVVVLGAVEDGKVRLVAGVTKDLTNRFKAGELVGYVAAQVGGKGGGRPDLAQAGGAAPDALPTALASVAEWVREKS